MTTNTVTGYARTLTNFEHLTLTCESFPDYAPTRERLATSALRAALALAKERTEAAQAADIANRHAIAYREEGFAPLSKLITRVNAALRASTTSDHMDQRALTLFRLIQGHRASPPPADAPNPEPAPEKGHSASHMSYDARVSNYGLLGLFLAGLDDYNPDDEALKVPALQANQQDLAARNSHVHTTEVALAKARSLRDTALAELVALASDCKAYVLSQYGSDSPEYQRIKSIPVR